MLEGAYTLTDLWKLQAQNLVALEGGSEFCVAANAQADK